MLKMINRERGVIIKTERKKSSYIEIIDVLMRLGIVTNHHTAISFFDKNEVFLNGRKVDKAWFKVFKNSNKSLQINGIKYVIYVDGDNVKIINKSML
jgi:uncharacterized protein YacL (UPF0231 family)